MSNSSPATPPPRITTWRVGEMATESVMSSTVGSAGVADIREIRPGARGELRTVNGLRPAEGGAGGSDERRAAGLGGRRDCGPLHGGRGARLGHSGRLPGEAEDEYQEADARQEQ